MQFYDSKGTVIGISDSKNHRQINLINVNEDIRIKIAIANAHVFNYFVGKRDDGSEIYIPMKNVIEDGKKEGTDYVYKII